MDDPQNLTIVSEQVDNLEFPSDLLNFIICQFRLNLRRKPYVVQEDPEATWRRLRSAFNLARDVKAQFVLAPEYTLPFQKVREFAHHFNHEVNRNAVYCIPVEHLSLKQLLELAELLNIDIRRLGTYFSVDLNRFDQYAKSIFNIAIVAVKNSSGKTFFHLQPKIFPALLEESKSLAGYYFQGGNLLTIFRSHSLSFAVIICFDFIGRGGLIPSFLRQWLAKPGNQLDLLFVLQVNPQPLHRDFERAVYHFANHQACQYTSLIFVNCDSSSKLRTKEHGRLTGFNRTAVVGRFSLEHTSEYTVEQAIAIAADTFLGEEVLQLNEQRRLILLGKGERVAWLRTSRLKDRFKGPSYPRTNDIRLFTYKNSSLRDLSPIVIYDHQPIKEPLPQASAPYRPLTIDAPALFVGRAEQVAAIQSFLRGKQKCLLVHGTAGIGKSALVRYATSRIINQHPLLFSAGIWLSSKDRQLNLKTFMHEMAVALNYPYLQQLDLSEQQTEILKLLRTVLRRTSIIIVDNVETVTDPNLIQFIGEISRHAKIILTGRNTSFPKRCRKYALGPMSDADIALLVKHLSMGFPERTLQQAMRLAGGSPFVLHLFFGYLRTLPPGSLDQRLRDITESGKPVVEWVFNEAVAVLPKESRVAINALQLFADTFTEEAINVIAGVAPETVNEAIDQLRGRHFIEPVEGVEPLQRRYQIHPLVRNLSRAQAPMTSTITRYIKYYSGFVKQHCRAETFGFVDHEIHNIERALELCVESNRLRSYLEIASRLYHYYYERGLWNDAIERSTAAYEHSLKLDNKRAALEASLRVSWCAFRKEDLTLAKSWLRISTKQLTKIKRVPVRLKGLSLETKARIDFVAKKIRWAEAQETMKSAIRSYERFSDPASLTLWSRAVTYLGELQLEQKQYQDAIESFNRVKQFAERRRRHPFATKILAWSMGNLGEALLLQTARYPKRVEYLEICANFFREGLILARRIERQHTIAHCSLGLGLTLQALKRSEAHSYLFAAREIYERLGKQSRLRMMDRSN